MISEQASINVINALARLAHADATRRGKYPVAVTGRGIDDAFQQLREERNEAYDAWVDTIMPRCNLPDPHCPEHPALAVELMDVVLTALGLCVYLGLDPGAALVAKMAANRERPGKEDAI